MEDFFVENKPNKINKKKIIIAICILILIIILVVTAIIYKSNIQFRRWIDKNIFRKEIMQNTVTSIELKSSDSNNIYAFNKYIGILNKNNFKIYNAFAKQEKELNLEINNPLFVSQNRYLAVAEKNGKKIYLIEDKEIKWEKTIDGNISQIYINKSGYVAVVTPDNLSKTSITLFDQNGNVLLVTFLSNTKTVDVSISKDNKYLAIAEVDTSGTAVQSRIKIISIDKAKTDSENSIIKTYDCENNKLITNIEYQDKNKLICMYQDSIHIIEDETDNILSKNDDKKIMFTAIELENDIITVEEQSTGLFSANSMLNIINTNTKNTTTYVSTEVTKEVYTYENMIALNLGAEVDFVNTNGWLNKKYIANQEITNIVLSNSIAGIIYRDRIEIINL